jgi:hypothetical protein
VRWVGIDEAGYGPNLGPLVMTAVVAEDRNAAAPGLADGFAPCPDVWSDLAATVDRAGGDPNRLWIDDSKAVLRGGQGRDRLEAACLAAIEAAGFDPPSDPAGLLVALGAGSLETVELGRWLDSSEAGVCWHRAEPLRTLASHAARKHLEPPGHSWRIVAVRTVVLGPARFNALLARLESKARVHFSVFEELLRFAWELASDGLATHLECDKHGGRHYYLEPLTRALPDTWISRGVEGADLSRYSVRKAELTMTISLSPRADGSNGLVALASMVSKTVREVWMDHFNAFWARRLDGLRPTAGYPVDAVRFRSDIEALAESLGLDPSLWWRRK